MVQKKQQQKDLRSPKKKTHKKRKTKFKLFIRKKLIPNTEEQLNTTHILTLSFLFSISSQLKKNHITITSNVQQ